MSHPVWNIPNYLSLSRLPLAVGVFVGISYELWPLCLALILLASFTDWADGWWARRYGPLTIVGRNLDPLTDKVLVCGAFIYLVTLPDVGVSAWMATLIVARELIVTGIRGIVEATGKTFGADWFGKLKMVLQCIVLIGIFLMETLKQAEQATAYEFLVPIHMVLLYLMLTSVIGSMIQYTVKAAKLLKQSV